MGLIEVLPTPKGGGTLGTFGGLEAICFLDAGSWSFSFKGVVDDVDCLVQEVCVVAIGVDKGVVEEDCSGDVSGAVYGEGFFVVFVAYGDVDVEFSDVR